MSLPNIPNITPSISLNRCDAINLLLSSIALEEISLSHILNAEGEKLQLFVKQCLNSPEDLLRVNESVNKTLRTVVKSQMMLEFKLEEVIELSNQNQENCCSNCKEKYECECKKCKRDNEKMMKCCKQWNSHCHCPSCCEKM